MTTYPLTLPAPPIKQPRSITPRAINIVGVSKSPFTGQRQVQAQTGQFWEFSVELPPMRRDDAEEWISFLLALEGRVGTFLLGDPAGATPRGSWGGTPLVNGASQTGNILAIDGLSSSVTNICKAGDYLQIGTGVNARLHKVLYDASSNSSGQASVTIWPRLRASPSDNAAIIVSNTQGLFALKENSVEYPVSVGGFYSLSFEAEEVL